LAQLRDEVAHRREQLLSDVVDEAAAERDQLLLEVREEAAAEQSRLAEEADLKRTELDRLDEDLRERRSQLEDEQRSLDDARAASTARLQELEEEVSRRQLEFAESSLEQETRLRERRDEVAAEQGRLDELAAARSRSQEEWEQELARHERELEEHRLLAAERKKELLEQVGYEVAAERELLLRTAETEAEQTRLARIEETRAYIRGLVQEAADDVAEMRAQSDAELAEARNEVEHARNALRSDRMLLRQQLTHLLEHARRLEMGSQSAGLDAGDWSQAPLEISPVASETSVGRGRMEQLATEGPQKMIGRLLPPTASPPNGGGVPVDEPDETEISDGAGTSHPTDDPNPERRSAP
ncbi:MAG TPA: hypothetical protein VK988_20325, partial [Acidimicrobiales bacterium]|nr:hypothetical protein [Acidimicrobiales bacterium]